MWSVFMKYDRVVDVYIPPRNNKQGLHFGFVRFINVQDAKRLEAMLDTILIGNQKMQVKIPMFEKGSSEQMPVEKGPHRSAGIQNGLRTGMSYANIVTRGNGSGATQGLPVRKYQRVQNATHTTNKQWNGIEFDIIEKEMEWLKGTFIGKTKEYQGTFSVQQQLNIEGWINIVATPIGGIRYYYLQRVQPQ